MSIYSLTVAIERLIYFSKAKKQSLAFAKLVTAHLKQDKLQEAIDSSKKFKHSHLARVVSAGLYEFQHDMASGTARHRRATTRSRRPSGPSSGRRS